MSASPGHGGRGGHGGEPDPLSGIPGVRPDPLPPATVPGAGGAAGADPLEGLRPEPAPGPPPGARPDRVPGTSPADRTGPAATTDGPASGLGLGAMHDTLAIVAGVAGAAGRTADRTRGLADRFRDDRDRLLIALGGGPPRELRETRALSTDAVTALDDAATALREAASALRSFARRSS